MKAWQQRHLEKSESAKRNSGISEISNKAYGSENGENRQRMAANNESSVISAAAWHQQQRHHEKKTQHWASAA